MLGHERRLRQIKKELRIAFFPLSSSCTKIQKQKSNSDGVAFFAKDLKITATYLVLLKAHFYIYT